MHVSFIYCIYMNTCVLFHMCACTGCHTEHVDLNRFMNLIATMILSPFL